MRHLICLTVSGFIAWVLSRMVPVMPPLASFAVFAILALGFLYLTDPNDEHDGRR